jgi:hypothetical protein
MSVAVVLTIVYFVQNRSTTTLRPFTPTTTPQSKTVR